MAMHTIIALFMSIFFSSRRRHTRLTCDWSSDVCSSDLEVLARRQALEERRLDGHAVDEPAHCALLTRDVVAEHAHLSALVQEQGREHPHERSEERRVGIDGEWRCV